MWKYYANIKTVSNSIIKLLYYTNKKIYIITYSKILEDIIYLYNFSIKKVLIY